ncbi:unnamed protein product [Prorocentrum cordatum]|uniref:Uncharacterized protein n=1 Tax=Prorocentrum cordatum TaxID=2364126 RepID=A0ABN9YAP7_9DINO|nr:unnamed protein product [Polarella glacialis]
MTSGSSFASRIALSSASAGCHCSPFSHALMPALQVNDVGLQLRLPHLAEQRQRWLPLPALFARADPSAVNDDVGLQLRLPHLAQQRQRRRDDVGLQLRLPHLAQQCQRPLPLPALLARADPSAVAMMLGSSFASHISLSTDSACCHCPPFLHALTVTM